MWPCESEVKMEAINPTFTDEKSCVFPRQPDITCVLLSVCPCSGMSRWGEYNDLHQIDEMAETAQETVVKDPLPG